MSFFLLETSHHKTPYPRANPWLRPFISSSPPIPSPNISLIPLSHSPPNPAAKRIDLSQRALTAFPLSSSLPLYASSIFTYSLLKTPICKSPHLLCPISKSSPNHSLKGPITKKRVMITLRGALRKASL